MGGIIITLLIYAIVKYSRKLKSNNKDKQVELGKVTRVQKIKYAGLTEEKTTVQHSHFYEDSEAFDE
jgi:hypothetical protein